MSITMYTASAPTFVRMLKNTKSWLDKAQAFADAKKFDSANFLAMRLAPDMLPFTKQIQIASDHAKGCVARLAGVDVPRFEDNEASMADLQARLDKTLAFIEGITAAQVEGSEQREIVLPSPRGDRHFKGEDYLHGYALPNFYFHVTTAYALLRHAGVDIGKGDYLVGGIPR